MYLRVLTCLGCTPSAAAAPIRASNPWVGMKLHAGGMGQNSVFSHVFAAKSRVKIGIEVCKAILFHSRCNYGLYATWVAPLVPNQAETPDLALFLEPRTCYTPRRSQFTERNVRTEISTRWTYRTADICHCSGIAAIDTHWSKRLSPHPQPFSRDIWNPELDMHGMWILEPDMQGIVIPLHERIQNARKRWQARPERTQMLAE